MTDLKLRQDMKMTIQMEGVKLTVQEWSWPAVALRPRQVQLFNSIWCPALKQGDIKEFKKIQNEQTCYKL